MSPRETIQDLIRFISGSSSLSEPPFHTPLTSADIGRTVPLGTSDPEQERAQAWRGSQALQWKNRGGSVPRPPLSTTPPLFSWVKKKEGEREEFEKRPFFETPSKEA